MVFKTCAIPSREVLRSNISDELKHISRFLIYQLIEECWGNLLGVLRGFAFGARANPRQILAPDGFRCIQASNRLPDFRLGSAGGLEVQRILIFPKRELLHFLKPLLFRFA